jgi:REP element-mobilizing transposase RayT
MSVKKLQINQNTFYFCTITCFDWLPLFQITDLYDHIYKLFDLLKASKVFISGFVIMPNHLHLLLFAPKTRQRINNIIGTGKRFMSYEIVKRLKKLKKYELLSEMHNSVVISDRQRGKLHQVFERTIDLKEVVTGKFLKQKLNYIHKNPISGKWDLVDDYRYYEHSSAKFYCLDEYSGYEVVHYADAFVKFG